MMPKMQDLKLMILEILAESFKDYGFILKKSVGRLTRQVEKGEDIIGLISYSFTHSEFDLIIGKCIDEVEKTAALFEYENGFSKNKNYKGQYTISCYLSGLEMGKLVASDFNSLASQLSKAIMIIKNDILPLIDVHNDLNIVNQSLNRKDCNLWSRNYFSRHKFFDFGDDPFFTDCIVACMVNDENTDLIIQDFLKFLPEDKKSIYERFLVELRQ